MENKQDVCNKMCEAIRATDASKFGGALKELRYMKLEDGREIVRPIFEDGTGNGGYYDVDVTCDSGIAIIMDITKQFIRRMW